MGLIFYLSSLSSIGTGAIFSAIDKIDHERLIFHFIEYGVLGVLLMLALLKLETDHAAAKLLVAVILIGVIYGVTDEIHQIFVPGRVFSLLDMVFDGLGTLIGAYILAYPKFRFNRQLYVRRKILYPV